MPVVPITKQPTPGRKGGPQPSAPMPPEPFQLMAAAQMHAEGRLIDPEAGRPMDITSQAQKADRQKTANDWPEGTSPFIRKTFNDALKSGGITQEQYNKAMRDPRQFQEDQ